MSPVAFSEIEDFPCRVLKHHWPEVPNLGDMTAIDGTVFRDVDILWGSTPCQAFSLAGLREGTSDPRGALALSFCRLADQMNPPFICWENVKGVLSDRKTNAFGCLLGALAGEDTELVSPGETWSHAGYVLGPKRAIAWRLFDAQYSGVAQRRQRVFLVACPRGGADPRQILFEQGSSYKAPNRSAERSRQTSTAKQAFAVAFRGREGGEAMEVGGDLSNCLLASQGGSDRAYVLIDDGVDPHVRLLTPLECERVMGIRDNHTNIPGSSDSVRWKAIGNSIAVPDVRWIGERILAQ
jgi:DNA (cytosine-5)-methyltransferase 1